jgi:hypothetical protein
MNSVSATGRAMAAVALFAAALWACAPSGSATPPVPTMIPTLPQHLVDAATIRSTSAAPPVPGATKPAPSPSATVAAAVQVTALGNVYVRRGPDLAFNPISIMSKGAVATATGRDVLSNWVRVPLPEDNSEVGWLSIMSEFTQVSGDVAALPEIDPQVWPEPASVRNCTLHELWIHPAGLVLPPVYEFPNNEVRLDPGLYTILDVDVEGYPELLKADLSEGTIIEVLVDGLGEKKKCPLP